MLKINNLSIKVKLNLIVFASILCLITIGLFGVNKTKDELISERKAQVKAEVETAISLVNHFYSQSGILGEDKAKELAKEALRSIRYDSSNYFWILNSDVTMVMHPTRDDWNGKNLTGEKDGAGKLFFLEMTQISNQKSAGYVEYSLKAADGAWMEKVSYVATMEQWDWIIGTGILLSDIDKKMQTLLIKELGFLAAVSIALFAFSLLISNSIVDVVKRFKVTVEKISEGDLVLRINAKRQDEMGDIGRSLDAMLDKLQDALLLSSNSANSSIDLVSNIAASSNQCSVSVDAQYAQLDMLSTAMTEMSSTNLEVTRNAELAASTASSVSDKAKEGTADMAQTVSKIETAGQQMSSVTQMVDELKDGVLGISEIVTVIDQISEQTNLLALNAAIEAARAGQAGRGFAVVADEVRKLAASTGEATSEIQQSINQLTDNAISAARAVNDGRDIVQSCVESSNVTGEKLEVMVSELAIANDMVTQIATSAEEQSVVASEISENLVKISGSAQEVSEATTSLADQSQVLVNTSEELAQSISFFKIEK